MSDEAHDPEHGPTGETEGEDDDALNSFTFAPGAPGKPDGRPFAPGTPEERYLRNHTQYLTHGPGGKPAMVWRYLLGIALNVGLVTAPSYSAPSGKYAKPRVCASSWMTAFIAASCEFTPATSAALRM